MDKQKQIEEIAKHGCYDGCASGLRKFCEEYDGNPCNNMVRIASGLYEQGYRKIPENAVVLTREEYEWLTCYFGKFEEIMNDIKKSARKETAEKFANDIEDILKQPFEGKTEKQEWQRKGMEEGLRMALEICKEITGDKNAKNE